ncbi:hypothetical protein Chor_004233 [Crotalus horridus]
MLHLPTTTPLKSYNGNVNTFSCLPKSDPGHCSGTFQVANGMITCDLAQEVMRKRHASEPSKSHAGPTA